MNFEKVNPSTILYSGTAIICVGMLCLTAIWCSGVSNPRFTRAGGDGLYLYVMDQSTGDTWLVRMNNGVPVQKKIQREP